MLDFNIGNEKYPIKNIYVDVPGIREPVGIRPETSDEPTFVQVFENREYALPVKVHPRLIIDGGANVGYASIWFANQFPQAQIIAIEPDFNNFERLHDNTRKYKNIERIQAGIWNKACELEVITHDEKNNWLGYWGFQVKEATAGSVNTIKSVTIKDILDAADYNIIDILKLDLEGSEKEVFSENIEGWLSRTNIIVLELHDRFKPGCTEALKSVINDEDFHIISRGENAFLIRKYFLRTESFTSRTSS